MSGNTFGKLYQVTTFGESHGEALGVVLDGLPSGLDFDPQVLEDFLSRRRPGGNLVSSRQEGDRPEILSGLYKGKTLGTPLACLFRNQDARSEDYQDLKPRRGHADQVWLQKFAHVDRRGGGRSSGRETVSRVVAGAFAKMALNSVAPEMEVRAKTASLYKISESLQTDQEFFDGDLGPLGFKEVEKQEQAAQLLAQAKKEGQSYGGRVEMRVQNPPASLGQPVFQKTKAKLGESLLSVGAIKSVSFGDEVDFSKVTGRDFHSGPESVYGGILGGITTGETIRIFADVKPTSSILDVAKQGRHDPCIIPRVLVVLESMLWISLYDLFLNRKTEV